MLSEKYKLKKFMKFTNNVTFRELFINDKNCDLICLLLALHYEVPYKELCENVEYIEPEMTYNKDEWCIHNYDLILSYNQPFNIGVKLNTEYWKKIYNQFLKTYPDSFSADTKVSNKKSSHVREKPFNCVQINNFNFPENEEFARFRLYDAKTDECVSDQLETHYINIKEISKKSIDAPKLTGYEKLGLLMSSESLEDVENICKDIMTEEELENILNKIVEFNLDDDIWKEYEKEELKEKEENN